MRSCNLLMPSSGNSDCIQHRVSMTDTLDGIAIKYGVEVADIKRLNGLTTDLQIFAYNSLQIPASGRHTSSTITSGESSSIRRHKKDVLTSIQPLESSQGSLTSAARDYQVCEDHILQCKVASKDPEMTFYTGSFSQYINAPERKTNFFNHPHNLCYRQKTPLNHCALEHGSPVGSLEIARADQSDIQKVEEKLDWRWWKTDYPKQASQRPVKVLKDDNKIIFSRITDKSTPALRYKPANQNTPSYTNSHEKNSITSGTSISSRVSGLCRTSSTSSLHEEASSLCLVSKLRKWAKSQTMRTRSLSHLTFDDLQKPPIIRRNKSAID